MSRDLPPLQELRRRTEGLRGAEALRRWARRLAEDPRAGARAIGHSCARRSQRAAREERRLRRLFELRRQLRGEGVVHVAGVDEVGVGPLAGPVVAAAVILPDRARLPALDDSKRLRPAARERLDAQIRAQSEALSIAELWPEEIDRLNIYQAALEAMRRAVIGLSPAADHVLVDARRIPRIETPQTPLVGGDGRDASIAAASIVAKVHRDAIMRRLDREYPAYGFRRHMGYGTKEHLQALRRAGPCPIHRRSFAPVAQHPLFPC
jgi:ribonuclease HII